MMSLPFEKEFCFSLPKIELHAHLNGSLSAETLHTIGCQEQDIQEYQKSKNLVSERNLQNIFKKFSIAHTATSSIDAVYTATKNVIKEFAQENVIYLELRTTPRSEETMSAETYVETIIRAIQETNDEIIVKLILSLNRQHSLEICENNFELILKMKSKYPDIIRGVDLSGNPIHGSFQKLKRFFVKAKYNNLFTTIHCGEIENQKEIKDILEFKPDRIGHACYLHPNYNGCRDNWSTFEELKIPTEICLTSNIQTGSVGNYDSHHVQEWIKNDLPFSLNTDDKGVFDTSLSEEFECASKYFKLSALQLWNISMNSIEYSFAKNEEKLNLRSRLIDWKGRNYQYFQD